MKFRIPVILGFKAFCWHFSASKVCQ